MILAFGQGSIVLATSVSLFAVIVMLGQQMTDAFWLYYESTSMSLRQLNAPESMLGRINGAFESIEFVGPADSAPATWGVDRRDGRAATDADYGCGIAGAGGLPCSCRRSGRLRLWLRWR